MSVDAASADLATDLENVTDGSILTAAEIRQFVLAGFVKVRGALPQPAVAKAVQEVWQGLEVQERAMGAAVLQEQAGLSVDFRFDRHWPSSWERGDLMMKRQLPSQLLQGSRPLQAALDDLLGTGCWSMDSLDDLGWAPLRFPAAKHKIQQRSKDCWSVEPALVEAPEQYHLDGSWYQHRLICPQQAIIICPILTDIQPGGAGTALKLASHFAMADFLAAAGAEGLSHAELCSKAQALDKQHFPEYEICCQAGDVLLLHPHLAHSSTTNVRPGAAVRLALTKRGYWASDPPSASPALWPMHWASANGDSRPAVADLVGKAAEVVRREADDSVFVWEELKDRFKFEGTAASREDLKARLLPPTFRDGHADLGGLLLVSAEALTAAIQEARQIEASCLGLARCGLGPVGGHLLGKALAAQAAPPLRCLMLQGNVLEDAGVVGLLSHAPGLRSLQTLSLAANGLTSVSVDAVADALAGFELRQLNLSDNSLGAAGAFSLSLLASRSKLQMLGLRNCSLKDEGLLGFLEHLCRCELQAMDLEKNKLTDAAAHALTDHLVASPEASVLPHLTSLSLRSCSITDEGASPLIRACFQRRWRLLDLGKNWVSDLSMRTLAELMEGPSQPGPSNDFGEILLGTNDVSDLGFVALCDALCPGRATLGYLNLTSNRLTSVSVCRMTAVLESWCQAAVDLLPLGGVDVTYNDASIQSVLGFRSALRRLSATRPKDACQHMFTAGCG